MTLPVAFASVRSNEREPHVLLERHVRRTAGREFRRKKLIPTMITRIKELFDADVRAGDS